MPNEADELQRALESLAHRIISRLAGYYVKENISWETYQLSATAIKATLDEIRREEQNRRAKYPDHDR